MPIRTSLRTLALLLRILIALFFLSTFVALWVWSLFPSDKEIRGCLTTKMYHVHLCPGSDQYVRLNQISPYLEKAVVLTEDASFWNHNGFDIEELEKSLKKNIQEKRFARGGSTITQQLAKNMFLTKEKTLSRKLMEALITIRIEKTLKKSEILERYLNVVQFGKDLFGIQKASQYYFSKRPKDLTLVESAFLTFLLPSPEKYSVSFQKKQLTPFARQRLNQIIDNLFQYHRISEDEYTLAKDELSRFLNPAGEVQESKSPSESELDPEAESEAAPEHVN
ncbi:MAG: monofunctional biosynthetic peptidoglycan transglycosylase [Oligoflexia bacterium]|nr:MAG: monofunctional biosynthetic peptidoglycan transglycosylase [Oligoflexia bacterium]